MKKTVLILLSIILSSLAIARSPEVRTVTFSEHKFNDLVERLIRNSDNENYKKFKRNVDSQGPANFLMYEDLEIITVDGVKTLGGDVPCARLRMSITTSFVPATGPWGNTYTSEVDSVKLDVNAYGCSVE